MIERYGSQHGAQSSFCAWSIAKSITHALVGVLVRDGRLRVSDRAPVPEWRGERDPRRNLVMVRLGAPMPDPLDGFRLIDVTQMISGRVATRVLEARVQT